MGGFPRLESSLLYFDGIVSALRGCWLFALYGYRPGVLYLAFIIKKYFKTIGSPRRAAASRAESEDSEDDDGVEGVVNGGSPAKREVARLVSSFNDAWHV